MQSCSIEKDLKQAQGSRLWWTQTFLYNLSFILSPFHPPPHRELLQRKNTTKYLEHLKVLIVRACVPSESLSHPHPTHMEKTSLAEKFLSPCTPSTCCFFSPFVYVSREVCGLVQGKTKAFWLYSVFKKKKTSPLGSISAAKGKTTNTMCQIWWNHHPSLLVTREKEEVYKSFP